MTELLYRGLWGESLAEYTQQGTLTPRHGSLSAGTGVFFTTSKKTAESFGRGVVLVTTKDLLDPEHKVIDTRVAGYNKDAKQILDARFGKDNYTGYDVWDEITKNDTITYEGGEGYMYSARRTLTKADILAELWK